MGLQATLLLTLALLHGDTVVLGKRQTWNGCDCKKSWRTSEGRCDDFCCNPDGDDRGEWCMVADPGCEDVDWGYCRDARLTHVKGTCADDPPGWTDGAGRTCSKYVSLKLCNSNGGYGAGWDADWGTFADAATGATAPEACCGCGGGVRAAGMAPQDESCADLRHWKDSNGDGCATYAAKYWCNASGYGLGWHEEWGNFDTFMHRGATARSACCACGGGKRLESSARHAPRTTWNGCACKRDWQTEEGARCDGYCCALADDREWCLVHDHHCEDSKWGYCRPLGAHVAPGAQCFDDPEGWRDSRGKSCSDYGEEKLCTSSGGYGPGWDMRSGTFHSFMNQQRTAVTACCICGGGRHEWLPKLAVSCSDDLKWRDKEGDSCAKYKTLGWCSEDGLGPGWHMEWGDLEDFADEGVSAEEACCRCGGGKRTRSFVQHLKAHGHKAIVKAQEEGGVWFMHASVLIALVLFTVLACCLVNNMERAMGGVHIIKNAVAPDTVGRYHVDDGL